MAKYLASEALLAGGERLPRRPRRLRLRRGVRRRAQVPRDPPLQGRADLQQPRLRPSSASTSSACPGPVRGRADGSAAATPRGRRSRPFTRRATARPPATPFTAEQPGSAGSAKAKPRSGRAEGARPRRSRRGRRPRHRQGQSERRSRRVPGNKAAPERRPQPSPRTSATIRSSRASIPTARATASASARRSASRPCRLDGPCWRSASA